jgi:SAM-dependent methyltransferase
MRFVCPRCYGILRLRDDVASCDSCATQYSSEGGLLDFAHGNYFDSFNPALDSTPSLQIGLQNEIRGTRQRIIDYYAPILLAEGVTPGDAVLDVGCGNGLSVDLLNDLGYDAWGIDLSLLRKWQWRERSNKRRLGVADARALPFESGSFKAVIASGVIEHIGVDEWRSSTGKYGVRARETRDEEREAFLIEILRVVALGGVVLLDAPNGLFPIDFWHADHAGAARWHSRYEGFLPVPSELTRLAAVAGLVPRFRSAHKRLQFGQVRIWWYGRLLAPLADLLLRVMKTPGMEWLTRTSLNPFLVVQLRKPSR